mmetsp:Transcript_11103/g.16655  ORF Transcript_11103/g.16655 Transcript_11103/m.16655 type:complete len:137 (+) Transcript_11103:1-411(+)
MGSAFLLALLLPLPKSTSLIIYLRDKYNPPLSAKARATMLNGYASTGKTYAYGFGESAKGLRVQTELKCSFDPGLAFTTLSACTVASTIVKRSSTEDKAKPGFQTAVTAVGGERLAEEFRAQGVTVKVSVAGASKL